MQCLARSAAGTARKFRVACRAGGGCAAGDAQHRADAGDDRWSVDGMGMLALSVFFSSRLFFSLACNGTVTQTRKHLTLDTYQARRRKATPVMPLASGAKCG